MRIESANQTLPPGEATAVTFRVRGLNLFYCDFQALENVDIDILTNRVTSLIGPSGCGKSTFLRVLNRMNDVIDSVRISGVVEYDGKDVYREFDVIELRRRIGMVFQHPNPFPMSIYDNIAYGPRVHGITRKDELDDVVERSLKRAALWEEAGDRLKKPALSLSGGQQQRLCIARALAVDPEVILMDEPTSALDPISTNRIEDLVTDLRSSYTIVIITHNLGQAGRISDFAAFFLNGKVVESGDTKKVFFEPEDPQTEAYITGRFG